MKKIIQSAVHFLCFFAFWTAQSQSCPNSDNVPELDGSVCITTKAPLNYQEGDENIYFAQYKKKKPFQLTKEEAKEALVKKIVEGDCSDNIPSIFKGKRIKNKNKRIALSCNTYYECGIRMENI